MPSLTPTLKFLLDENVKAVLLKYLKSEGFEAKFTPYSAKDSLVANISIKEQRILVTNDHDFQWYTKDQIFSVILLNIPQHESNSLISSFKKLLKEFKNFKGRMILLESNKWTDSPLWEEIT